MLAFQGVAVTITIFVILVNVVSLPWNYLQLRLAYQENVEVELIGSAWYWEYGLRDKKVEDYNQDHGSLSQLCQLA